MATKKKTKSMEELLQEVNGIMDRLREDSLPFEESLAEFQKANQLLKECSDKVEKAEQEFIVLDVNEL